MGQGARHRPDNRRREESPPASKIRRSTRKRVSTHKVSSGHGEARVASWGASAMSDRDGLDSRVEREQASQAATRASRRSDRTSKMSATSCTNSAVYSHMVDRSEATIVRGNRRVSEQTNLDVDRIACHKVITVVQRLLLGTPDSAEDDKRGRCHCGRGELAKGTWTHCDDPDCRIGWVHTHCLSSFEKATADAYREHRICETCFIRRTDEDKDSTNLNSLVTTPEDPLAMTSATSHESRLTATRPSDWKEAMAKLDPSRLESPKVSAEEQRHNIESFVRMWTSMQSSVQFTTLGKMLFNYRSSTPPSAATPKTIELAFICEADGGNSPRVDMSLCMLCDFSPGHALLVNKCDVDLSEPRILGPFQLAFIEKNALSQAKAFLLGKSLIIGAQDCLARAVTDRNLSTLVQISCFAHWFDLRGLQAAAMHGLWHFIVLRQQNISRTLLETLLSKTMPGCPARLLLLWRLDQCQQTASTVSSAGITSFITNELDTGERALVNEFASMAAFPKKRFTPNKCAELFRNRKVTISWKIVRVLKAIFKGIDKFVGESRGIAEKFQGSIEAVSWSDRTELAAVLIRLQERDFNGLDKSRQPPGVADESSNASKAGWVVDQAGHRRAVPNPWKLRQQYLEQLYGNLEAYTRNRFEQKDAEICGHVAGFNKAAKATSEAEAVWLVAVECVYKSPSKALQHMGTIPSPKDRGWTREQNLKKLKAV